MVALMREQCDAGLQAVSALLASITDAALVVFALGTSSACWILVRRAELGACDSLARLARCVAQVGSSRIAAANAAISGKTCRDLVHCARSHCTMGSVADH